MRSIFLFVCLLMAIEFGACTFWPFVPGGGPTQYSQPAYSQPAYQYASYPCGYGRKRRQAVIEVDLSDMLNPVCKSKQLNNLMVENMSDNPEESARVIQHAAKELGDFNVFCATGEFGYKIDSNLFCKVQVADLVCYAFSSQH
uniref:Ground-like domain-containing protein n=1 Tax=Plectus sambesii TaxID=2011161 RepID=A0A914VK23_9BILA